MHMAVCHLSWPSRAKRGLKARVHVLPPFRMGFSCWPLASETPSIMHDLNYVSSFHNMIWVTKQESK